MELRHTGLAIVCLVFMLTLAGCSDPEEYGAGVDSKLREVLIIDILSNRDLQGESLTIQGRIVNLCPSRGCWFYLQDESGQIFVDLSAADITLPYRQGKTVGSQAKVSGMVTE